MSKILFETAEPIDLGSILKSINKLEISEQTTETDASAAMQVLSDFNQCMAGIVNFSGLTPWERHPDDEFLHVLDGEVAVTILSDGDNRVISLSSGSVFVVPKNLWHKQHSATGVKLLFITSSTGNDVSEADDPR
jgi:mannose-6-phosphate isomerase-like protein (cupin superfamily)